MSEATSRQFQQQYSGLRHSLTVPNGFRPHQKRYSTPNPRLQTTDEEVAVPLMKAISSVPHEGLSARNPVWMEVQDALIAAFKGRSNPNLGHTAKLVRLLGKTVSPGLVFDYLENSLLKKGFKIICRRLDRSSEDPEELLESLEATWRFFHDQLVLEVKCILQSMGMNLQQLDRALMLGFRDQVLLPTGIQEILRSEAACGRVCSLSPGLTRMVLVLQMHRDSEPPSDNDVALERIAALTVRPFIGFLGVYNGTEEPELRANVPELVKTRRRLTRRAFVSRSSVFRRAGNGGGGGFSDSLTSNESPSGLAGADVQGITIVLTDECCNEGDDVAYDDGSTALASTVEASDEEAEQQDEDSNSDEGDLEDAGGALGRGRFLSDPGGGEPGGKVIFV